MSKILDALSFIGICILALLWLQPLIVGIIDFTWNLWTGHSLLWNWDVDKYFYAFVTGLITFALIGSSV